MAGLRCINKIWQF